MVDAIVIGAGPAGMMAAGTAAQRGRRVLVLEKNDLCGKKLRITGKGRCNVTNDCEPQAVIEATRSNGRFLYGCVNAFSPADTVSFFENLGVPLKTERGGRVFPVSDRAVDIAQAMIRFCERAGVQFRLGCAAAEIETKNGAVTGVRLQNGETLYAPHVLIACGGASYPGTGSDGSGARLAAVAGHLVTPLRPSLVPLETDDGDCPAMQGLSLRNVGVTVEDRTLHRRVFEDFGELLFTHFGLSGPTVLRASAHLRDMAPGRYRLHINLKPALSDEQLDARLLRDFAQNSNRQLVNVLHGLLPAKMVPVLIARGGLDATQPCHDVTREQRRAVEAMLRDLWFDISGFRPLSEAIVTAGGVDVREVDPKTMASKRLDGLYFAGEVLDLDAYTGGFNLQIAFSTGRAAGMQL